MVALLSAGSTAPRSAPAKSGNASLRIEVYPSRPVAHEEVAFVLRFQDPDVLTNVIWAEICFLGSTACNWIDRYPQSCTIAVGALNDKAHYALPGELLATAFGPPYTFRWRYSHAGTYRVEAWVEAVEAAPPCDVAATERPHAQLVVEVAAAY